MTVSLLKCSMASVLEVLIKPSLWRHRGPSTEASRPVDRTNPPRRLPRRTNHCRFNTERLSPRCCPLLSTPSPLLPVCCLPYLHVPESNVPPPLCITPYAQAPGVGGGCLELSCVTFRLFPIHFPLAVQAPTGVFGAFTCFEVGASAHQAGFEPSSFPQSASPPFPSVSGATFLYFFSLRRLFPKI